MTTVDLHDFLLARIAEDEAKARAATPGPWRWDRKPTGEWGHQPPDLVTVAEEQWSLTLENGTVETGVSPAGTIISSWGHDADGVSVEDGDADHIARWDPARVLAECDAKRRIVELHEMVTVDYAGEWWTDPAPPGTHVRTGCGNCTSCGVDGAEYVVDGPCDTLKLLALPYADHPDYLEEWKP